MRVVKWNGEENENGNFTHIADLMAMQHTVDSARGQSQCENETLYSYAFDH